MQFVVRKERLLKALQSLVPVVERKQTKPILSNVHVCVKDNLCRLTTTDTEIQIQEEISVEGVQVPGAMTFSARKGLDICRSLPDASLIEVSTEGPRTVFAADQSRFVLSSLPADEFPFFEAVKTKKRFEMPQKHLKAILAKCFFAVALEDIRSYLNGVYIRVSEGNMLGVATDGHRLALHRESLSEHDPTCVETASFETHLASDIDIDFIMPRKAVTELQKLLGQVGMVSLEVSSTHVVATIGSVRFSSALTGGRYPNYSRVIPKIGQTYCVADTEAFKQALTRTLILCDEKLRGAHFVFEEGTLTLTAHNVEQEEARNQLAIDYSGERLETAFNLGYLLDALSVLDDTAVKISFTQQNGSIIIEELNHGRSLFVVMVMQL